MGWSSDEPQNTKKGMETSSKILLAIIACLVLIIILIMVLILNIQETTYTITVDGVASTVKKEALLTKVEDTTYINIEEFAKLVKYEYHKGEYKAFTIEDNKCYVQGANETASFYLDDNKVYKLAKNDLTSEYMEFTVDKQNKEINGTIYAPIDAIMVGFNVQIAESENSLTVFTLDYLVTWYDTKAKEWGYTGIADQNFENKKSILYGYLIVKKESGLYKIIDNGNTKEIVSDKYTSIQFSENTKEFFVTNSLGQVGIINLDGTTKLEPIYESISVLNKEADLYLIQRDKKYGVVKSGNITIIYPEYDSIGLDTKNMTSNVENHYLILDTLIPVCKDSKWGAFDKKGKLVYKLEYDGFGCNVTNVEINGTKKVVEPVLTIKDCDGLVVKQGEKYKLLDIKGKELISTAVDAIYIIKDSENGEYNYYMLYNNQELNIIEKLIEAELIEDPKQNEEKIENNITTNTNTVVNNITSTASDFNNINKNQEIKYKQ